MLIEIGAVFFAKYSRCLLYMTAAVQLLLDNQEMFEHLTGDVACCRCQNQ